MEGGSGESSREESCDGEMRLLQLHLAELKKLRSRMEQLDTEAHNGQIFVMCSLCVCVSISGGGGG